MICLRGMKHLRHSCQLGLDPLCIEYTTSDQESFLLTMTKELMRCYFKSLKENVMFHYLSMLPCDIVISSQIGIYIIGPKYDC